MNGLADGIRNGTTTAAFGDVLITDADYLTRHADDHRMVGDGLRDDCVCADTGITADRDVAQHLRARADDDAIADRGMALHRLQRCATQRHALIDRDVITDDRSLADDDTAAMVDEDAGSDLCTGMDLDLCPEACDL